MLGESHEWGGGGQTSVSQIEFAMMKDHFDCRLQVSIVQCPGGMVLRLARLSLAISITKGKDWEQSCD